MGKRCQVCDGPIVNGRCKYCGMPYRNDMELYHLNEDRSEHYRHASEKVKKAMAENEIPLSDRKQFPKLQKLRLPEHRLLERKIQKYKLQEYKHQGQRKHQVSRTAHRLPVHTAPEKRQQKVRRKRAARQAKFSGSLC